MLKEHPTAQLEIFLHLNFMAQCKPQKAANLLLLYAQTRKSGRGM